MSLAHPIYNGRVKDAIRDAIIIPCIYRTPKGKAIYVVFINNTEWPNRFCFDGNPSTSKFLV